MEKIIKLTDSYAMLKISNNTEIKLKETQSIKYYPKHT